MDFIIFIDAGHGGKDNGATYLDIYEDEINYQIASKLYDICIEKNIITYITRTGDYDLASQYAKNRKKEDLYKRQFWRDFLRNGRRKHRACVLCEQGAVCCTSSYE